MAQRPLKLGRVLAVMAGALVLAVLVLINGTVAATRQLAPEMALRWNPLDARANANLAVQLVQRSDSAARANGLAMAALRRDVTYVPAFRARGMLAALRKNEREANALFDMASNLSRRDLPTRLWLIESAVARDDIDGALHHYDIALRTSKSAKELLFPILVEAFSEPQISAPLSRLLRGRPPWAEDFLPRLYHDSKALNALAQFTMQSQKAGQPVPIPLVSTLVDRLVNAQQIDLAMSLYRARLDPAARIDRLRNGDFSRENPFPPLDWLLSNDVDVSPARQSRADKPGNMALYFGSSAQGGPIARQILALPGGQYRLSGIAGAVPSDMKAYWLITCLGRSEHQVATIPLAAAPEAGAAFRASFSVPTSDCPYQFLYLNGRSSAESASSFSWIDDLAILPE